MLKDPIAWLIVRTLGLLLTGYSALQAYAALGPRLLGLAGGRTAGAGGLLEWIEVAALAAVGLYLLRRGRAVQRLLMHESR